MSSTVRTFPEVRPCLKEVLTVEKLQISRWCSQYHTEVHTLCTSVSTQIQSLTQFAPMKKEGCKKKVPLLGDAGSFSYEQKHHANPLEYLAKRFHRGSDHLSWCYQKLPRCRSWRIRALSRRWIVLSDKKQTFYSRCSSDAMRWLLRIINKMRFS